MQLHVLLIGLALVYASGKYVIRQRKVKLFRWENAIAGERHVEVRAETVVLKNGRFAAPGINLIIVANRWVVLNEGLATIDLSGRNGTGGDGGNFTFIAKFMRGRVHVISLGGKGRDGGEGAPGVPGQFIQFDKLNTSMPIPNSTCRAVQDFPEYVEHLFLHPLSCGGDGGRGEDGGSGGRGGFGYIEGGNFTATIGPGAGGSGGRGGLGGAGAMLGSAYVFPIDKHTGTFSSPIHIRFVTNIPDGRDGERGKDGPSYEGESSVTYY